MAGRGCDISDADIDELLLTNAKKINLHGEASATKTEVEAGAKLGSTSAPSRPGEGLSRDEKRSMGSWASRPSGGGSMGHGIDCCKCKERPAKVSIMFEYRCTWDVGRPRFLYHQA